MAKSGMTDYLPERLNLGVSDMSAFGGLAAAAMLRLFYQPEVQKLNARSDDANADKGRNDDALLPGFRLKVHRQHGINRQEPIANAGTEASAKPRGADQVTSPVSHHCIGKRS